jgi:Ni,Fe-hydrogenase III small subunit
MTDIIDIFLGDLKCALQRFEPNDDDVFVLTVPGPISIEDEERIKQAFEQRMHHKVIVLGDGATLTTMAEH